MQPAVSSGNVSGSAETHRTEQMAQAVSPAMRAPFPRVADENGPTRVVPSREDLPKTQKPILTRMQWPMTACTSASLGKSGLSCVLPNRSSTKMWCRRPEEPHCCKLQMGRSWCWEHCWSSRRRGRRMILISSYLSPDHPKEIQDWQLPKLT